MEYLINGNLCGSVLSVSYYASIIDRFYPRGQNVCKFDYRNKSKRLRKKTELNSTGFVWKTNVAAVSSF